MQQWLFSFVAADDGEDLVEYALLVAFIGLACVAAWQLIEASLGNAYQTYDNSVQDLWVPPEPSGGGGP